MATADLVASSLDSVKNNAGRKVTIFGLLALLTILVLGILVAISQRRQGRQHRQFRSTVQTIRDMRGRHNGQALDPTALWPESGELPENLATRFELPKTTEAMLRQCLSYAHRIDEVSGREKAATMVANLVFRLSQQLGYSPENSLLHSAVGLVYDIGFLAIDPRILREKHISEDEFEAIKAHTLVDVKSLDFIEESYRKLFFDGITKHHENLDGSGYPRGLKGMSIPFIAKTLRVTESFLALISRRTYRDTVDQASAIQTLQKSAHQYDRVIVSALDTLIT